MQGIVMIAGMRELETKEVNPGPSDIQSDTLTIRAI